MMGAFACGWNVILRKKTLEDNNYNLRRVVTYPGTGPFRPVRRVENELWVMERNPNYWNKGLPYLDGIEFYHGLPFSPELGSAFLSGRIDYARLLDPVAAAPGQADAGHVGHRFLPERHPGDLGQQPEEALRRPARPPRHAPRARQGGAGRGGEGRGADDGRRLHLPVLGLRHAAGGAFEAHRLPGRSRRRRPGGQGADGGRGARPRHHAASTSSSATSPPSSSGRRPSRPCCSRRSTSRRGCARWSNPYGSTTCGPAISTSASAPSCPR